MVKKSKKSKKIKKLPRQLLFIPSSDKNFIEQWDDMPNRDPLNFPKSFRICLIRPVGVGKTMLLRTSFVEYKTAGRNLNVFLYSIKINLQENMMTSMQK